MKHCLACKQVKPLESFSKNKRSCDGYSTWCRDCNRAYGEKYYQANKHKWQFQSTKEKKKAWYSANLEIEREKSRERAKASLRSKRAIVGQKECSHCGQTKDAAQFARRRVAGGDGLKDICKLCVQKLRTERKREEIARRPLPTERACKACAQVKPINEYYICKSRGLVRIPSLCKPCKNKETVEYAKKNPERKRECARAYRAKNPDKIRAHEKRYQEKYPEKAQAKKRAGHIRRKLRLKHSGERFTGAQILELLVKQVGLCVVCRTDISKTYHVDHVTPLARGGSNNIENIQLLCPSCNLSKNSKTMEEFLEYRERRLGTAGTILNNR